MIASMKVTEKAQERWDAIVDRFRAACILHRNGQEWESRRIVKEELPGLRIRVETRTQARTGVEMEALCAVSAGLLAVYDMCKGRDRAMVLEDIRLLEKDGGRSGAWRREGSDPPSR